MDEREYKRLDKKRKLKTASGYNCAKEIVAQTAIIADDYDKLKKEGAFDAITTETNEIFSQYLKEKGIAYWNEPYQQIKQLLPALHKDFEKADLSLHSIKGITVALAKLIEAIRNYCTGYAEIKTPTYPVQDLGFEMTADNCTEFVDGLFHDALSITNDAMKYFEADDRGHLAFTASLLSEIFFMLGMASTDMEFSFSSSK